MKELTQKHKSSTTFTEGSLFKGIILFSLPLMASQILQVLFNMADVAVVGKFSSAEAKASRIRLFLSARSALQARF